MIQSNNSQTYTTKDKLKIHILSTFKLITFETQLDGSNSTKKSRLKITFQTTSFLYNHNNNLYCLKYLNTVSYCFTILNTLDPDCVFTFTMYIPDAISLIS